VIVIKTEMMSFVCLNVFVTAHVATAVCINHMRFLYKLMIFIKIGGVLVNTFA
jgi:hypothetical protein